ncbi:MAG TPA: hypothetical protein VHF06_08100 [Pseudonocardiaceae bacterium]|jgi:hypothetical protein|nr:hypothetical protein [Pseudonocardiaceae bacterium]
MGDGYERPAEADGWRPGQAGALLLAGTRPEHLTATLVDLAVRGHLTVDVTGDTDWSVTRQRPAGPSSDRLARYERELLAAVFGRDRTVRLADLPASRHRSIAQVHRLLTRDVMRQGAIEPRTAPVDAGPEIQRLRTFRERLRAVPFTWLSQGAYLPYAIAFGLGVRWAEHFRGADFEWMHIGSVDVARAIDTRWIDPVFAGPRRVR